MELNIEPVKAKLKSGRIIQVEARTTGEEEDVASAAILSFDEVTGAVEEISEAMVGTLQKIKPQKASIEFGLEVAVESGKLTAMLVKGSGTASLKVKLEWGDSSAEHP